MYRLYSFIIAITLLVSVSFLTHGKDSLREEHSKAHSHSSIKKVHKVLLKELFKKTDFSKYDRDINSVLDKQHVSQEELDLLKAQALAEALEENAYDVTAAEGLILYAPLLKEEKKPVKKLSFNERLNEIKIDENLKNELSSFATTLRNLLSHVKKGLETFQKSDEMAGFTHETEKTSNEAEQQLEKTVEEFIRSEQFKQFQGSATAAIKKLNKAIQKGFKEETDENSPPRPVN